jgi:hypothetical protein
MIVTACLEAEGDPQYDDRLTLLRRLIEAVRSTSERPFLLLLPGGFLNSYQDDPTKLCRMAAKAIAKLLKHAPADSVIAFGVDGRDGSDQLGLAVNRHGLIAKARKFFPVGDERYYLTRADSPWSFEENQGRLVRFCDHAFYLAVCYDSFGIKKERVPRLQADAVLNLVHGFSRPPASGSGSFYFARDGMLGAARTWDCPVFAAAHFDGGIHQNWPTGVVWDQGEKRPITWRYNDNPLCPSERVECYHGSERVVLSVFRLSDAFAFGQGS